MKFKPPSGQYSVSLGKISLPPTALVYTGNTYTVTADTLCGRTQFDIDASPKEAQTAEEFARRCQISGSIQHVTRKGCAECREQYQHGLTVDEKRWLYTSQPTLGPILGITIEEGSLADRHKPLK